MCKLAEKIPKNLLDIYIEVISSLVMSKLDNL